MIEWVSRPRPVSCRSSCTSMSRHGDWLMKYSLSPLRNMRRVIVTSSNSSGSVPSELSSTRSTSAIPTACRAEEPAKTTSSIELPRSDLADCSPRTHSTASEMLDLPEPLGPTMTVTPGSRTIRLRSAKDLKPLSVSDLRYNCDPSGCVPDASRSCCDAARTTHRSYHRKRFALLPCCQVDARSDVECRGCGGLLGCLLRAAGADPATVPSTVTSATNVRSWMVPLSDDAVLRQRSELPLRPLLQERSSRPPPARRSASSRGAEHPQNERHVPPRVRRPGRPRR